MNRTQHRYLERLEAKLHGHDTTETHTVQKRANEAEILSNRDTRIEFAKALTDSGWSQEEADKVAYNASVRAVRKEGYKL